MRLFLDSSVLLAASGSERGASRELFRLAAPNAWQLIATPYVVQEVLANLGDLPPAAGAAWTMLHSQLTLDRGDFGALLGRAFYGLGILKPGDFLQRERLEGGLSASP